MTKMTKISKTAKITKTTPKKRKYCGNHVPGLTMIPRILRMSRSELEYSKDPPETLLRQFFIIFYGWESGLFNFYNSTDAHLKIEWHDGSYHADGMTHFLQRNLTQCFSTLKDEHRFSLLHIPRHHKIHAWQKIRLDARTQVESFLANIKSNCARKTRAKTMSSRVNLYHSSRDFVKQCNMNGEFRIKESATMYRYLHGQHDIDMSRFNDSFTAFSLKEDVAKQHVSHHDDDDTRIIRVSAIFDPGCVLLPIITIRPASFPSLYEYILPPLDTCAHSIKVLARHMLGQQLVGIVLQISPSIGK